ncbi:MAG: DUF6100 family protein [Lachnospiraceae bacterium]|nr:DUF6100 family protein [Lachnospiraceae bacterium]MCM1239003.1 DUF6100 family protein [Lachnospiraceae bacterium]
MDRKTISHRITDIQGNLSRLNNNLCAMDSLDIQRYPENYETLSTEAALRAEGIACQMRSLLYASTSVPKAGYLVKAADIHGIEISYEDGILEITMPRLLPKRKTRQSSLFLVDPLHAALGQYLKGHPLPRFRECVVCISHVYDHELPDWCLLDYDNLQQKQILDTIALYVMADDSGLLCDAYNTTQLGDKDGTCIYIMEKNRFAKWLSGREQQLKSISDF